MDAMRNTYDTDFAITNSGGLRADLTRPSADVSADSASPVLQGRIKCFSGGVLNAALCPTRLP
jgi:hypothetical protein